MDCIEAKLGNKEVDGVKILDNLTIYHRIFANDFGVFIPATEVSFNKLQSVLKLYKTSSGTKLNLSKLVIVPLALPVIPQFLTDIGCIINAPRVVQKYLGAPFGQNLKSSQLHNFCLDRISKRIKGWAKKLLSFTRRTMLIKYVLQSILIYHMMYVETRIGTTRYINRLFKDLLWGFFTNGSTRKVPLIAWERLAQPKEKGGIGFKDCLTHS